jgi:V/A-type H+-transporting ATPase subunit C
LPKHRDGDASLPIREREDRLLRREQLERLAEAEAEGALLLLLEEYGWGSLDPKDQSRTEAAIQEREVTILEELAAYPSASKMLDIFRIQYDYHNAKVILKSEASGRDGRQLLSKRGRIEPALFLNEYRQDRTTLPPILCKAMAEAREVLSREKDAGASDILLDRAMYREYLELSKGWKAKWFKQYVHLLLDAANLKTAVRARRAGVSRERLENLLVDGGNISAQDLAACASAGGSIEALYASTYLEGTAALAQAAMKGDGLAAFERQADNALAAYLKTAKNTSFGPARLIAYMAAVEAEGRALRIILTCRRAGIAPAGIRERLRDCYV